ncbi:transglutaminaseTgpA domain-containing protein [Reinekea blandensis]|uniref:Transglutaminase-like protein n=1 Tax=Reinekea blandensis MED297 TaxID=314283 RepID=A4BHC1_9GAMM|nr:DUF3488 and transglutaminase-like domain-containing protein [Reinekea blandensis]EAR08469.1 Transglutaminase-like protein [Reinekea sp. MED297] [Reinekea blandensis MED297]
MTESEYIPPYRRVLSQAAIRTLLVAQFFMFLVFVPYMPNWFVLVFVFAVFWRWRVIHGQLKKPPVWLVLSMIVAGIAGIVASGFSRYSLDTAVAFCLLGYLLKSLEVLRRRDGIFQVYLGFFLSGVYLLYRFDPLGALLLVFLVLSNLLALQAVTSEGHFRLRYALKQSTVLMIGAVPIMVAGYLFFPRLPPLWNIPNDERGAQTGMSDEMRPGSVAELAQSNEPAFRVSFNGERPPRDQWYWRGNTMSVFDGETWRARYTARNPFAWPRNIDLPVAEGSRYDYTVIQEKSGQRWMYFLDWPVQIDGADRRILPDARAAQIRPINNVYRYQAVSSDRVSWSEETGAQRLDLALPQTGNEALRAWANERYQEAGSDWAFVERLLTEIREQDFYYTLRPPLYRGEDSIEAFWLGERRGFCEHYASAMAFMLRAVGIPSRIVGGYLGGTYVPGGDYIQVRQREAHAWVEVWIDSEWHRVDPTAVVSPNRIEMNLDELFMGSQPEELSVGARLGRATLVNQMIMYWDNLNYQWQVLVLDYDNNQAIGWFTSAFGEFSPLKAVLALLSVMGGLSLAFGLWLGLIPIPKVQKEPYRSLNKIERLYGGRGQGETLHQYAQRLAGQYPHHQALGPLLQQIEQCIYDPETDLDRYELRHLWQTLQQERKQDSSLV